jgi:hypothetical protein
MRIYSYMVTEWHPIVEISLLMRMPIKINKMFLYVSTLLEIRGDRWIMAEEEINPVISQILRVTYFHYIPTVLVKLDTSICIVVPADDMNVTFKVLE